MSSKLKVLLVALFFTTSLVAQQRIGLHFMRHVYQTNLTNPAFFPDDKRVMSLVNISNNLTVDGITYNEFVTKQDGKPVIIVSDVLEKLDDENYLRDDYSFETYGVSFPFLKKFQLSFGHSIRYHAFFKYPKELMQLLLQGNAQFIGETIDISNELQLTGYHSLAFGFGYRVNDNLTLGTKIKFLSGFADASTAKNNQRISLYTDPDIYQLTLNSDYILNTASAVTYRNLFDNDADFTFRFLDFFREPFFKGNTGLALDLGANLELGKLVLAASMIDLGRIKWRDDSQKLVSQADIQYDGINFSGAISGEGGSGFGSSIDTLEDALDFQQVDASYTSPIPTKFYLSALYHVNEKFTFGATAFHEEFRSTSLNTIAVGGNAQFKPWLNFGLTYAVNEDSYDNLGVNLTLESQQFQVYTVTDNVISLLDIGNRRAFGIRFGGNLFF